MTEVHACSNCLHFIPKKRSTEGSCLRHTHINNNGMVERGMTDAKSGCWEHSEAERIRVEHAREQSYEDMRGATLEALIRIEQIKQAPMVSAQPGYGTATPQPEPQPEPQSKPKAKTARKKA